jgi:MoxR-like ATPase
MATERSISELTELIRQESAFVAALQGEMSKVIVGQRYMIERLLIGLLANGHVLLEGVPGLAKTLAVKSLASVIHTKFQRIQFTPDLLPADLIGTLIYNPRDGTCRTSRRCSTTTRSSSRATARRGRSRASRFLLMWPATCCATSYGT